ncbi:MAG: hypothetical protein K1Y02_22520 [Candidatus Hydrogenedentes bacterium]|nr:hypothetical protein [Candidatus Hydrogenedentota bacterium]
MALEATSSTPSKPGSGLARTAAWAVPGVVLLVACGLRLAQYLHNKAIWLDEAYLALNILNRSYSGLLERLDYGQGAPFAFLMLERAVVDYLGSSEFALRAVPLLAGLLSVVLLCVLLRRWTAWGGAMFALALFAVSGPCIRYSGEVKQYATDVLVTLVLLLVLSPMAQGRGGIGRGIVAALTGAAAVWCAYPAIFVLAGAATTLTIDSIHRRRYRAFAGWSTVGAVWAASFAAYYLFSLHTIGANIVVRSWWTDTFMPFPPRSFVDVNWFVRAFFDYFNDPLGMTAAGVGAILFVLGVGPFFRRAPVLGALLLTPLAFALLASGLQRYPFTTRFLLFTVPLTLPFIAEGFERIRAQTRSPLIPACIVAVALMQPSITAARSVLRPEASEGIRPTYEYLKNRIETGDTVYVYHWAIFPLQYYEKKAGNLQGTKVLGESRRADWSYYVQDIASLRGKSRVWFVFETSHAHLSGQERQFFTTYLDTVGKRLDAFESTQSSAYLYDLGQPAP